MQKRWKFWKVWKRLRNRRRKPWTLADRQRGALDAVAHDGVVLHRVGVNVQARQSRAGLGGRGDGRSALVPALSDVLGLADVEGPGLALPVGHGGGGGQRRHDGAVLDLPVSRVDLLLGDRE